MTTCQLKCKCGATCLGKVIEDDPDTNSFAAEPMFSDQWEGGNTTCSHEDYTYGEVSYDTEFN